MISLGRQLLMDTDLIGLTVVITGATSGIGLATATALAKRGVALIGLGRSADRCRVAENVIRSVQSADRPARFLAADLSLQAEVRRAPQEIRTTLQTWESPRLDVLINNAATVPFWQTSRPKVSICSGR